MGKGKIADNPEVESLSMSQKDAIMKETKEEAMIYALIYDAIGQVVKYVTAEECALALEMLPTEVKTGMKISQMKFECDSDVLAWKEKWHERKTISAKRGLDDLPDMLDLDDDIDKSSSKQSSPSRSETSNGSREIIDLTASSSLAKKFKRDTGYEGMTMQVHIFKNPPIPKQPIQVIFIEFVDKTMFQHWMHRATSWIEVFEYINQESPTTLSKFFKVMRCCNMRIKGVDEPQIKTVGKLKLNREGFRGFVSFPMDPSEILQTVTDQMEVLFKSSDLAEMYAIKRSAGSRSHELIKSLKYKNQDDGQSYWKMLEGSVLKNHCIIEHDALNEVFLSGDMRTIMKALYGVDLNTDVSSMPDELKRFTFGGSI